MPSNDDSSVTTLDRALEGVEGWFSPDQVARVAARAAEVPPTGRIVEIGSFRGRSMVAMALSAPEGAELVAIDPHAGNDRGPQEIEGYEEEAEIDAKVFLANLERAGVRDRVRYVRKFSHEALDDVEGPIDLLHIDRELLTQLSGNARKSQTGIRSEQGALDAWAAAFDMALEMANFTRNQILLQSGTAMLAQANAMPQAVLQLLGS